jgi:prolipoprotein diacylglyceryl transferase
VTIAAIPSPSTAVWHLGPVPIRAYALCIVLGIVVACVVTEVRLRRRGAPPYAVLDVAVWAVPFGIVGARIYHVLTAWGDYFGDDGKGFLAALKIWEGGLGIWGAVAGGAVGAWLACRQLGIPLRVVADALAPGLPLAQAVGRFGNWFNNELYGGPTTLPWGLEVHRMDQRNPGQAVIDPETGQPELLPGLYHPAFLYEAVWNVGVALLVWLVDRKYKLGRGRAFALYVIGYTAGRFWIEILRTDEAYRILGARLNVWTSLLVLIGAIVYFVRVRGPQEYLVPADAAGFRTVTEDEYRAYQRTGAVAGVAGATEADSDAAPPDKEGAEARDGGPDDDGSDLVDADRPPLDDFADDETDDDQSATAAADDDADDEEDTGAEAKTSGRGRDASSEPASSAKTSGRGRDASSEPESSEAARPVGSADER